MASTDLYDAVKSGNVDKVEHLLTRPGADKQIKKMYDGNSETLVTLAVKSKNPKLIPVLQNAGADVNKRNFSGKSPLHLCAYEGDAAMAAALIQCGGHVTDVDDAAKEPLHWAVEKDRAKVIEVLVDNGADINMKTKAGLSLIHEALSKCKDETIKVMLDKKADIRTLDANNHTVLQAVAKSGRVQVLQMLVQDAGASVDDTTPNGETLLHICSLSGKLDVAKYLIEVQNEDKTFIDKQISSGEAAIKGKKSDTSGMTALHIVCAKGDSEFAKFLLNNGADKSIKNVSGKTAIELARERENNEILELFGESPPKKGQKMGKSPSQTKLTAFKVTRK